MNEYTCRKCGVLVRGDGFEPLKLCAVCSSSIVPEDKRIVSEFADTLKQLKQAKTPKEKAGILLEADRLAKLEGP